MIRMCKTENKYQISFEYIGKDSFFLFCIIYIKYDFLNDYNLFLNFILLSLNFQKVTNTMCLGSRQKREDFSLAITHIDYFKLLPNN